ncbi:hypothetical protein H9Q69_013081 [Fusarium xylarioides]|nr:hypothetical protein H9Q69_013081 [Fusarium xylarioides]
MKHFILINHFILVKHSLIIKYFLVKHFNYICLYRHSNPLRLGACATAMSFIVAGGQGGDSLGGGVTGNNGGPGAQLSGTVPVTPGQTVVLLAGGKGGGGLVSGVTPGGIGYGTGGTARDTGGGGGAGSPLTLNGRLVVVAGGGGGGGRYTALPDTDPQIITFNDLRGGGGGIDGVTAYMALKATPNQHTVTIGGGQGGGSSAAGAGDIVSGSPSLFTNGAAGGGMNGGNGRADLGTSDYNIGSGGGGSGYYGGGSGSVAQKTVGTSTAASGVGGGGGSNYVASGVTTTSSRNAQPGFNTVVFFS